MALLVEIAMSASKIVLLAPRRKRHAIDKVMTVALDVLEPQQGDQRQVLLHADAGERGQVFGRHKVAGGTGLAIPFGNARRVEDRFIEPLAVLAGDPGIAEALG